MKDLIEYKPNVKRLKVLTPNGWEEFKGIAKYKPKPIYVIKTESGLTFNASLNHSLIDQNGDSLLVKNCKNKLIKTKNGLEKVIAKTPLKIKDYVYDFVGVPSKVFFCSAGILHHNTHLLEEFWSSVIPAISSGKKSKVMIVSTPNGVGNKFYEIFSGAESGSLPSWKPSRIDWWDRPGRDEQWKQDQIQLLGSEEKFLQEFGNTFLDDAAGAVGALVIERLKNEKKNPIWTSDDGEYCVFEYPEKRNLYVIGVDVGEGIGRAASVAQILDVTDLQDIKQVAVYASNKIEPYHFANKLSTIGQSWGIPPMLIERNNCGAQVIDALHHKHNYEKIVCYSKISEQDKYNRTRNMGVLSHTNIKFDGIQNMRYWINHLQTVHINDPHTISEFETFVRFPNGVYRKRNDNFFDDRVMALVWALFILESDICQQYFEIVDYDMQHKPQKIKDNGYWEKIEQFYELKELSKQASIIPKPYRPESELISKTLDVTQKDTEYADKYDEDLESLLAQGYEFL